MILISIDRITATPTRFGEHPVMKLLMADIQKHGLLAPIQVILDKSRWFWRLRPKRYICVDGVGRLEACRRLKMKKIPASVLKAERVDAIHRLNSLRSNDL